MPLGIVETTAGDAVTLEGKVTLEEEAAVMLPLADPARSAAYLERICQLINCGEY
jgi:hypothetical protein